MRRNKLEELVLLAYHLLSKFTDQTYEMVLQIISAHHDRRFGIIVIVTIIEYLCYVTDELGQIWIELLIQIALNST